MSMFCYQCEQAAKGTGCTTVGVCGKQPEVAALQDLLVYTLKGIAFWADKGRAKGAKDQEIDRFMIDGLFTTVTNVDFDAAAVSKFVSEGVRLREQARQLAGPCDCACTIPAAAQNWALPGSIEEQVKLGELHGVKDYAVDADVHSVREIIIYGLKGYGRLRRPRQDPRQGIRRGLRLLPQGAGRPADDSLGLMDFVGLAMECGSINLVTMGLLNEAHVAAYGHPVPTKVSSAPRPARPSWFPATT